MKPLPAGAIAREWVRLRKTAGWVLLLATASLVADEAKTRVPPLELPVNVHVKSGGALRAELLDKAGQTMLGFTVEDCEPITGDHRRATFHWRGGATAPAAAVKTRCVFKRAFLTASLGKPGHLDCPHLGWRTNL
jgi:hypothetical protein